MIISQTVIIGFLDRFFNFIKINGKKHTFNRYIRKGGNKNSGYRIVELKKLDALEIGYYGKPIVSLTREELLEAFAEVAAIINECSVNDKKIEALAFIKKGKKIV